MFKNPIKLRLERTQLKQLAEALNNIAAVFFASLVMPFLTGQGSYSRPIYGFIISILAWSASIIILKVK